jgi:replicative DNA helicase
MTKSELTSRVVCGHAGVDSRKKRRNELNQSERGQIVEAVRELHGIPLSIIDKPGICIEEICAVARVEARRSPLDLVVVDYIGLVKPSDKTRQRNEQVAEITFALKNLAKELSLPVVALSQLNRQADDSPPKMSHLRESGAVEQDADIVLFLHPEQAMSDNISLICGKHRHGTAGSLELTRNGLKMLFDEKIRYTEFVG